MLTKEVTKNQVIKWGSDNESGDSVKSLNLQTKLDLLMIEDARKNCLYVPVLKLTKTDIRLLNPKVPIDPYSSIEDVSSSDPEDDVPLSELAEQQRANRYNMQSRPEKRMQHSRKPLQAHRNDINYRDFLKSDSDADSPKRTLKRKYRVPSGPSRSQIDASVYPKNHLPRKHFHHKDPSKTVPKPKLKQIEDETESPEPETNEEPDNEADIKLDPIDVKPSTPAPTIKPGNFQTKEHGLRKFKKQNTLNAQYVVYTKQRL